MNSKLHNLNLPSFHTSTGETPSESLPLHFGENMSKYQDKDIDIYLSVCRLFVCLGQRELLTPKSISKLSTFLIYHLRKNNLIGDNCISKQ